MKNYSWLFLCFLVFGACTKKEPKIEKMQLMLKMIKLDKTAQLVKPKDMKSGIKCSDYGPGCRGGHMAKVLDLDCIFLEFESVAAARKEALRIDAYYFKNWVLDDFAGEPKLERFAELKLKAIRARVEAAAKNDN